MVKNKIVESVQDSAAFSTWKLVMNTIIHMFNAVVFLQMINFAVNKLFVPREKQKLHIIFSTLGYQLLMMEAIMAFNANNSWSRLIPKKVQKLVHLAMQMVAGGFVIAGFSCAVANKDDIQGDHFVSAHAILGLIGFLFTCISILNGFVTFFLSLAGYKNCCSTFAKLIHNVCGCFAIVTGLASLIFGIDLEFFRKNYSEELVDTLIAFISICMFYILANPLMNVKAYLKSFRS